MADTFKFVQAQPFSLSGAGAVAGATSVVLKSFKDIEGTNLAMTDFGSIGYGTIEPGNGTQEEQISFTGVTQNANGTATLTGVKTVLFKAPYTESSGLAKTHAGATTFVISNTAGFYNSITGKNNDETITGTWTFTSPNYPRIDDTTNPPTDDEQFATKKYADDLAIAGSPVSSTSVIGIVKVSYDPIASTNPIAVADNDPRVPTQGENDALVGDNTDIAVGSGNTYVTQTGFQKNAEKFAVDSASSDDYTITLSPTPTSYSTGMVVGFKASTTNTGAATLNVNSLGAKTIVKGVSTTLANGDISTSQIVGVVYDGTNFVLQSPAGAPKASNGTITISSSTTTTITLGFRPRHITIHSIHGSSASIIGGTIPAHSNGGYDATTGTMWCVFSTWNQTGTLAAGGSSASYALNITYGNNPTATTATIGNITDTGFDIVSTLGTASPVCYWTAIG